MLRIHDTVCPLVDSAIGDIAECAFKYLYCKLRYTGVPFCVNLSHNMKRPFETVTTHFFPATCFCYFGLESGLMRQF